MNIKFYKVTLDQFESAKTAGTINYAGLYFVEDGNGKGTLYRGATRIEGNSVSATTVDSISASCPAEASAFVEGNMIVASVTGTDYKSVWVRSSSAATEDDAWIRIDASEKIDSISADVGSVTWDKVYLDDNFTLIGKKGDKYGAITLPDSGEYTISSTDASGNKKTVKDVMETIFQQDQQPTVTNPKVTITGKSSTTQEVGYTFPSATYTVTWSNGSYTYGPETNVSCISVQLSSYNGTTASSDTTTVSLNVPEYTESTVTTKTIVKATAKSDVSNATSALTKMGANSGKKITETTPSASVTLTTYQNMFYGTSTTIDFTSTTNEQETSNNIRSLSKKAVAAGSLVVTIPAGAKYIAVAVPSTYKMTKCTSQVQFGSEITDNFDTANPASIKVAGYDGSVTAAATSTYKVYQRYIDGGSQADTYTFTIAKA